MALLGLLYSFFFFGSRTDADDADHDASPAEQQQQERDVMPLDEQQSQPAPSSPSPAPALPALPPLPPLPPAVMPAVSVSFTVAPVSGPVSALAPSPSQEERRWRDECIRMDAQLFIQGDEREEAKLCRQKCRLEHGIMRNKRLRQHRQEICSLKRLQKWEREDEHWEAGLCMWRFDNGRLCCRQVQNEELQLCSQHCRDRSDNDHY